MNAVTGWLLHQCKEKAFRVAKVALAFIWLRCPCCAYDPQLHLKEISHSNFTRLWSKTGNMGIWHPMVLISSSSGLTAGKPKGSTAAFTAKALQRRRLFYISVVAVALLTSAFIDTASIFLNASEQEAHLARNGCGSCAGHIWEWRCRFPPPHRHSSPGLPCSAESLLPPVLNFSIMIAASLRWICFSWEMGATAPPGPRGAVLPLTSAHGGRERVWDPPGGAAPATAVAFAVMMAHVLN